LLSLKTLTTTNVGENERGKEALIHCWWECKLVQPLWKAIWRFLKKVKIELPFDPVRPLLGIHPKECKSGYLHVMLWNYSQQSMETAQMLYN
jgi:hypothetical protein